MKNRLLFLKTGECHKPGTIRSSTFRCLSTRVARTIDGLPILDFPSWSAGDDRRLYNCRHQIYTRTDGLRTEIAFQLILGQDIVFACTCEVCTCTAKFRVLFLLVVIINRATGMVCSQAPHADASFFALSLACASHSYVKTSFLVIPFETGSVSL